jgi:membrane fusion protein
MSDRELNARQMSLIQASQRVSALQRTMSSTANDRADLQAQIDGIPYRITAAEAVAQAAEAAFSERTTNAQADHAYVVTAQSAARVAALPVRSGQTVLSGSVLAVLVPPDQDLIAEIFIPSRAIGFVEVGQEVRLLYQAFPHQNFGVALGHVRQVSSTVIGPDEVSIPGLVIREPVFRVEAAIRSQTVQAYGETIPLQAGMLLDADIIVDRRNLVEWLFDPVFAAGRR